MESERVGDQRSRQPVAWLAVIAWMAIIYWLSSMSALPAPFTFTFSDKVGHFVLYLVLGILLIRAWRATPRARGPAAGPAVLCGVLYAASDELHQWYVPGRYADWLDFGADLVGLLAAVVIMRRAGQRK